MCSFLVLRRVGAAAVLTRSSGLQLFSRYCQSDTNGAEQTASTANLNDLSSNDIPGTFSPAIPVALSTIAVLAEKPSLSSIASSSRLLHQQLPARMRHHIQQLNVIQRTAGSTVRLRPVCSALHNAVVHCSSALKSFEQAVDPLLDSLAIPADKLESSIESSAQVYSTSIGSGRSSQYQPEVSVFPSQRPSNIDVAATCKPASGHVHSVSGLAEPLHFVTASHQAAAKAFGHAVAEFRDEVESMATALVGRLALATQVPGWWDRPAHVDVVDTAMDQAQHHLLTVRVITSQYLAAAHELASTTAAQQEQHRQARAAAQRRFVIPPPPALPGDGASRHPGHQPPRSLISMSCPLLQLLQLSAEDCQAFCVEKNSVAPAVNVVGDANLVANIIPSYLEYAFSEVLKNSMHALIARHGAWDVDEAEPIQVLVAADNTTSSRAGIRNSDQGDGDKSSLRLASSARRPNRIVGTGASAGNNTASSEGAAAASFFTITVVDHAGGMSSAQLAGLEHYFLTTGAKQESEAGYGYSRDHGAQFQGQGVGAPLARLYTAFMGGTMQWHVDAKAGTTTVVMRLPQQGFEF